MCGLDKPGLNSPEYDHTNPEAASRLRLFSSSCHNFESAVFNCPAFAVCQWKTEFAPVDAFLSAAAAGIALASNLLRD